MKYINTKTNQVVEATQWFKNGQHPFDNSRPLPPEEGDTELYYTEGEIVRRFNHPNLPGEELCEICGKNFRDHGFVDQYNADRESDGRVCPGDFIVTVEQTTEKYSVRVVSSEEFLSEHTKMEDQSMSKSSAVDHEARERSIRQFAEQNVALGQKEFSELHPSSYDTLMQMYKLLNGSTPKKADTMRAIKQAHGYLQGVASSMK